MEYPNLIAVIDLENRDRFSVIPEQQKLSNMQTRYAVCGRLDDAILFSAAPDLYEALEEIMLQPLSELHKGGSWRKAQAALAKAKEGNKCPNQ